MSIDVLSRVLAILLIFCMIFMQGCKTSKKKRIDPLDLAAADLTQPFDISGRVNANSLLNADDVTAIVTLHPVSAGVVSFSENVISASTDSQGYYTLTVPPEFRSKPAIVQALISDSQQPNTGELRLLLSVSELSPKFTNNITVLTHLASSRLLDRESLGSVGQASIAISDANSQVAGRFGVIGALPSLPLVAFSVEEWDSFSITSIRYSLIGRAILEAVLFDNPESTLSQALDGFSELFALYGMVDNSSFQSPTSYAEVLTQLIDIVDQINPDDGSVAILDRLRIELATELGLAQVGEPDVYELGITASSAGLSYVDKAKAMVQDIRQVVSSIDIQSIAGLSNISKLIANENPVSNQLEGFGIQVDLSELVSGDDFDYITGALRVVGFAVIDQLACYKQNNCDEKQPSEVIVSHGFKDISEGNNSHEWHSFTIDQLVNGCPQADRPCYVKTDLTVQLNVEELYFYIGSQDGEVQGFSSDSASITLNGTLEQGDLRLKLASEGPQIDMGEFTMGFESDIRDSADVESTYMIAESLSTVLLPFSLSKNTAAEQQDMSATLAVSVDSMSLDLSDITTASYFGSSSTKTLISETQVNQMKGLRLDITGVVNNRSDENFLVSINAAQPGFGFEGEAIYRQTTVEDCDVADDPETCLETDLGTEFVGETLDVNPDGSSHFVRLDVSVGYKAILKGVADPVIVQFSASRESPEQATINALKISYPGHSLNMKGTFTNTGYILSMSAINLDGITMSIDTVDGNDRYGSLVGPDGSTLADIRPTTDLVHITFDDGYFVSF